LVEFISQLTKKDLFIGAWFLGAFIFACLMWNYYKKANRRNFRPDTRGTKRTVGVTISRKESASELNKKH
jgi:hypothetical protein